MHRNDHVGRTVQCRPAFSMPGRSRGPPIQAISYPQTINKNHFTLQEEFTL